MHPEENGKTVWEIECTIQLSYIQWIEAWGRAVMCGVGLSLMLGDCAFIG